MNLEKIAKNAVAGGILLAGLTSTGCIMQQPKPGEFHQTALVAVPNHPLIMAIGGGIYQFEKITENGQEKGIIITKKHWLVGETGTQRIMYPSGAINPGIKNEPLINERIWISYSLPGGKEYLERYDIGFHAEKCKFQEKYVKDAKTNKYIKLP